MVAYFLCYSLSIFEVMWHSWINFRTRDVMDICLFKILTLFCVIDRWMVVQIMKGFIKKWRNTGYVYAKLCFMNHLPCFSKEKAGWLMLAWFITLASRGSWTSVSIDNCTYISNINLIYFKKTRMFLYFRNAEPLGRLKKAQVLFLERMSEIVINGSLEKVCFNWFTLSAQKQEIVKD